MAHFLPPLACVAGSAAFSEGMQIFDIRSSLLGRYDTRSTSIFPTTKMVTALFAKVHISSQDKVVSSTSPWRITIYYPDALSALIPHTLAIQAVGEGVDKNKGKVESENSIAKFVYYEGLARAIFPLLARITSVAFLAVGLVFMRNSSVVKQVIATIATTVIGEFFARNAHYFVPVAILQVMSKRELKEVVAWIGQEQAKTSGGVLNNKLSEVYADYRRNLAKILLPPIQR